MLPFDDLDQDVAGCDIVDLLHERNEQVRRAFASVIAAAGRAKAASFDELVTVLAVREAVAHELVHSLGGRQVRAAESAGPMKPTTAVSGLSLLAGMDVEDDTFDAELSGVARRVTLHLEAQERDDLPLLRRSLPAEELHALAEVLLSAESIAGADAIQAEKWRARPRAHQRH